MRDGALGSKTWVALGKRVIKKGLYKRYRSGDIQRGNEIRTIHKTREEGVV